MNILNFTPNKLDNRSHFNSGELIEVFGRVRGIEKCVISIRYMNLGPNLDRCLVTIDAGARKKSAGFSTAVNAGRMLLLHGALSNAGFSIDSDHLSAAGLPYEIADLFRFLKIPLNSKRAQVTAGNSPARAVSF